MGIKNGILMNGNYHMNYQTTDANRRGPMPRAPWYFDTLPNSQWKLIV